MVIKLRDLTSLDAKAEVLALSAKLMTAWLVQLAPTIANSTPLHLEISVDTPLLMTGTISGSLAETDWGDGKLNGYLDYLSGPPPSFYTRSFEVSLGPQGSHWTVTASVERVDVLTGVLFESLEGTAYKLVVRGHHNVAPHAPPETAPGLELKTWKVGLSSYLAEAYDSFDDRLRSTLPHPGDPSHDDVLTLFVVDLSPGSPGYLDRSDKLQLSASFRFTHPIPEPSALVLSVAGLGLCLIRLRNSAQMRLMSRRY